MKERVIVRVRIIFLGLPAVLGLLLAGCAWAGGAQATPVLLPFAGAPVTAAVDGRALVVANNSDQTIYVRIFPTDILPVIEWAPCIAPETCPPEQRIEPGEEQRVTLRDLVREQTDSITVFWWIYLEKAPGASIPPLEMTAFEVPLP